MKKTLIFLLFFMFCFSKMSYSYDVFGREEAMTGKLYMKEKAYSDAEEAYLRGDYKSSANLCEKITRFVKDSKKLDSVYYLEGLSYLKLKEYENSRTAFNKVLNNNSKGDYSGAALIGTADSFLSEGNLERAGSLYKGITMDPSLVKLHSAAYYRLAQIAKKLGNSEEASVYLDKLKTGFPLSFEAQAVAEGCEVLGGGNFVQVGSFKANDNAQKLSEELRNSGYDASVEKTLRGNATFYRVLVKESKDNLEKTAQALKKAGYPTKICP